MSPRRRADLSKNSFICVFLHDLQFTESKELMLILMSKIPLATQDRAGLSSPTVPTVVGRRYATNAKRQATGSY